MKESQFLQAMWKRADAREADFQLAQTLKRESELKDRQRRTCPAFWEIYRKIGLQGLYFGMADVLCLSFAVTVLLLFFAILIIGANKDMTYILAFWCAPILYASLFFISWLKEKQSKRLEIQLSYKHTFFHLLSARMFGSSILGMAVNGVYAIVMAVRMECDAVRLLAVSFTSLMLFSILLAAGMEKGKRIGWGLAAGGGWVAGNIIIGSIFTIWYEEFLKTVPLYVLAAAILICIAVYLRQLSYLLTLTFRKEYTDAAG